MRSFVIAVLVAIPLSFVLGLFWAKDFARKLNISQKEEKIRPVLSITTYRGWISAQLIETIEAKSNFQVKLEEFDRPIEIWQRLEKSSHDGTVEVTTLTSWQIEVAKQLGRIQELPDSSDCQHFQDEVAPDFRLLPDRPSSASSLPIAWAATGYLINTDKIKNPIDSVVELIRKYGKGKAPVLLMRLPEELVWLSTLLSPPTSPIEEGETDEAELRALENMRKSLKAVLNSTELIASDILSGPFTRWNPSADLAAFSAVQAHHTASAIAPFKDQKNWQFLLPKEKGVLWLGYLVPKFGIVDEPRLKELCKALQVISDEMAKEPIAAQFVESTGLALPFKRLDKSNLADEFKPSYIRKLPLNRMDLRKNFAGDATVETLLEEQGSK